MSYIKAYDILPEYLLKEIQKYVQGEMIYIPNEGGTRKRWGQNSGNREYLKLRNDRIRKKFLLGATVEELSKEFYLSFHSIKKIVYSKA